VTALGQSLRDLLGFGSHRN